MKRINLIKTQITNSQARDFILDYRAEFLAIIETVPEGITASQMGTAIKIASKLQNYERTEIFLEDAEWDYLKNKVVNARFQRIAPEIVAMVEAVENAATVDENTKTAGK